MNNHFLEKDSCLDDVASWLNEAVFWLEELDRLRGTIELVQQSRRECGTDLMELQALIQFKGDELRSVKEELVHFFQLGLLPDSRVERKWYLEFNDAVSRHCGLLPEFRERVFSQIDLQVA